MSGTPLQPRHWILGGALAATVAATLWAAQTDGNGEADAAATARPVAGARRAAPATVPGVAPSPRSTDADWRAVERAPWAAPAEGQFAAWAPPAPPPPPAPGPPPPPPPPAAPVAPPFPYQLIGRLVEGEPARETALLASPTAAGRSISAHAGEVIDGQWKVEQVGPTGVTVIWLPAQLKQQLAFRAIP